MASGMQACEAGDLFGTRLDHANHRPTLPFHLSPLPAPINQVPVALVGLSKLRLSLNSDTRSKHCLLSFCELAVCVAVCTPVLVALTTLR